MDHQVSNPVLPERKIVLMAIMVAMGIILHRLEILLPLPSPWIKLGLANVMTLTALVFLGFREALIVTGLRVVLSSIIGGTFPGPTFFLSLAGGFAAVLVMAGFYRGGAGVFSMIGISIAGAYAHTFAIAFSVYLFFVHQEAFLYLLPIFLTFALITGILTGIAANILNERLAKLPQFCK